MTLHLTDKEQQTLQTLITSLRPLLEISENDDERWVLWLDFLLEIQSKLVANEGIKTWNDHFPIRLGQNIYSLGHMFTSLAQHHLKAEDLNTLFTKLSKLQ